MCCRGHMGQVPARFGESVSGSSSGRWCHGGPMWLRYRVVSSPQSKALCKRKLSKMEGATC